MERKIGEVFDYEGHKLRVVEDKPLEYGCDNCYMLPDCSVGCGDEVGWCIASERTDNTSVHFKETDN